MKKFALHSTLSLSTLLLLGCSQMKRPPSIKPASEMSALMQTVEVDNNRQLVEAPQKSTEYTHEIAEATASDIEIESEVGAKEIDQELPGSESEKIPYSRDFLIKKNTKRMQFWVDYFTKKERSRFQRFINNGEEYRHHIERIFMENGLPKELYFVGLIESGYYLGARSHAAAVGPWQFIRGTGKRYGLKISHELDERQDLFKATRSAAMYFKNLHNIFSSWELSLSAYNAGENGIIRRIMKHGTRDFYELSRRKHLPAETINYVPKVLAAMHVVNNAEKYGFVLPKKANRLFDKTQLKSFGRNTSLKTIAERLNTTVRLLKKLNPELRREATPRYYSGTYYLRIPESRYSYELPSEPVDFSPVMKINPLMTKKQMQFKLAMKTKAKPIFHKVKRGDTLIRVAQKYHMSPHEIAAINGFKTWRTTLKTGQRIALVDDREEQAISISNAANVKISSRPLTYKVTKGDNLTDLARIFNLNVSKIKKANKLGRGHINVGQRIILPNTQKGIYTVRRGDHLMKVARNFNFPIEALVKINSLKKRSIYPGQKLIVNMD